MDINLSHLSPEVRTKIETLIDNVKPGTEGVMGIETSQHQRMKIQTVKIVQPTSLAKADCPVGARPGQLYTPGTNLGNSIEIIPVFAYNSRTLFSENQNDGLIECGSLDSKTGTKYGACVDCPHLPWRNDQRTRCIDNINVFAVSQDLNMLLRIIFSKTSETSGKFLVRQAMRGRNISDSSFTLSTESKSKNGKTWLQYKVGVSANTVSDEVKQACKTLTALCSQDYKSLLERDKAKDSGLITVEEPKKITSDVDAPDFPF
jgi:hypothetical protein